MREFGSDGCSPLGKIIRDRRLEKGIKQAELADMIGCSATKIHMMEYAGIYHSKTEDLKAIAKILDIDIDNLLDNADTSTPYKGRSKGIMTECVFNSGVECTSTAKCDKCGWSPMISRNRKEKRRKAERNRRKEQEHIVYESWKY